MAYPCNLPANTGNTDIFRAIYAKLDNIQPSTEKIEEKLDTLIGQVGDVNTNIQLNTIAIEDNTKAIKDISINVDIDSKDIRSIATSIDKQTEAIKDISVNVKVDTNTIVESIDRLNGALVESIDDNTEAVKHISCGCPPMPCPPHPHPCPPRPPFPCNSHKENKEKVIKYYSNKGCAECNQETRPVFNTLSTNYYRQVTSLEDLYNCYYYCYYPTFDDFFYALYGASENYYYLRDQYYYDHSQYQDEDLDEYAYL